MNSKARTTLNQRAICKKMHNALYPDVVVNSSRSATNAYIASSWTLASFFSMCLSTKRVHRSAGSSCCVEDSDGTISNDKTSKYPLMQRPMFSVPSNPRLSLNKASEIQVCESVRHASDGMPLRTPRQLFGVDPFRPKAILNASRYWTLSKPSMFVFAIYVKQTELYSRTDSMSPLYSNIKQDGCPRNTCHRFQ
jgi:hypothetical protein